LRPGAESWVYCWSKISDFSFLEFIFSSSSANTEDFTVSNFPASFSHEENEAGKFETVKLGSLIN
jgi:hypothetical protein